MPAGPGAGVAYRQRLRAARERSAGARVQRQVSRRDRAGQLGAPKAFRPSGNLGRAVAGKDANSLKLNVLGLQHFLRNRGYNVSTDGKLGPVTKAALKDAILSGTIKHPSAAQAMAVKNVKGQDLGPKGFDYMVAHAGHGPFAPLIAHGGSGALKANGSTNFGGGGGGRGGNGSVNPNPAQKALNAATGSKIPAADANFGQLFNVDATAKALANEQFGAQINDAQLQANRDPLQNKKNEQDVADWYRQVLQAQQHAGAQDTAATKAGVNATDQQTQALVASLGGGANQGSGEAAAAGQNASGTLQAIGAAQSGLDAELAPILQAQAAQQKTNQYNVDQNTLRNDQQNLANLQGQEGSAQVSAQEQLQGANNSLDQARQQALQNILEYNNSLSQQKYQNQLGLLSTETAAAMNGVNMAKTAAETNYYNARAAGHSAMDASQINDVQKQLMAALGSKGLIVSPSAGVYKLAPGVTPQQILQFSQHFDQSYSGLPGNFAPNTLNAIQGY